MIRGKCSFFFFSSFLIGLVFFSSLALLVGLAFFSILAGAYVEVLLEYFTEVLRITKSCHFCYFCYTVCTFFQQLHRTFQADQADVIARSLIGQCPEFVVEAGTAHSHQIAKHIYCKSRIVYTIFFRTLAINFQSISCEQLMHSSS